MTDPYNAPNGAGWQPPANGQTYYQPNQQQASQYAQYGQQNPHQQPYPPYGVQQTAPGNCYSINAKIKEMNKHVFVWVGAFLFCGLGVDRFMRGQIGLGILKILTFGGLGFWALIDFIIALVKVYGQSFSQTENVVFVNGKYAR